NEKKISLVNKLDNTYSNIKQNNEKLNYNKLITKKIAKALYNKENILENILNESKRCIMIINNEGYIVSNENDFTKLWAEYRNSKYKIKLNSFLENSIKNSDEFLHNIRKSKEFEKEIKGELEGKDGRFFSINYAPFIIGNENIGVVCSVVDITYEKKSELKIKENDTKYKKVVDNIPYSILITDENKILYNNKKDKNISTENYNVKKIILDSSINGEVYYTNDNYEKRCANIDRISFIDGEKIKNVVAIRDISKYKRLLQDLEVSKRKYESLVNIIPEGIYVLDLTQRITTYSNKAIRDMTNSIDIDEIQIDLNNDIIIESEKDNDTVKFEQKLIKNKYDEDVYLECGTMVINVNEKLNMIGITRDITNQVKAEIIEKEIEKKKKENKIKNEFFINISHELKTPLNVISSSNQLLEVMNKDYILKNPESEISKTVGTVKKHSYMLMGIINNIIDLAKLESDFHESKKEYYNIVSVIEDICLEFDKYIKVNNIKILFDTDEEEKIAEIDPFDMEKIILTLLAMIIRYLDYNSTVCVDLNSLNDRTILSINSKGRFDYHRYINDQERKSLDIGIEVAKSIVKLYDGDINIKIDLNNDIEIKIEFKLNDDSKVYKKRIKNMGDDFVYAEYLRLCNF
ncbi:MAG: histidine kinase dimerization/phospho-acceptor domain-containing protein, partial [Clostridia bacterium]